MYKKISKYEKITRNSSDVYLPEIYLTKETTESISVAVNKLSGKLEIALNKRKNSSWNWEKEIKKLLQVLKSVLFLGGNTIWN